MKHSNTSSTNPYSSGMEDGMYGHESKIRAVKYNKLQLLVRGSRVVASAISLPDLIFVGNGLADPWTRPDLSESRDCIT